MKNTQHGFGIIGILLVIVVFGIIGAIGWAMYHQRSSQGGRSGDGQSVKVRLIDGYSTKPIINTDVRFISSNGIVCITSPCPTEEKEWKGTTDNDGYINIPTSKFVVKNEITAKGYESSRAEVAKTPGSSHSQTLELDPDSKTNAGLRKFKLIDSATKRPLSGVIAGIIDGSSCIPPQCMDFIAKGQTNSLGNVYYPINGMADPSKSYVYVSGYQIKKSAYGSGIVDVELVKE